MCTYSKVKCGYSVYNHSLLAVIGIGCVCVCGGGGEVQYLGSEGFLIAAECGTKNDSGLSGVNSHPPMYPSWDGW